MSRTDNLKQHTDGTVDRSGALTVQFFYDNFGRQVRQVLPTGGVTTAQYDVLGRLIAQTDELGRTKRSEYDAQGRLTAVVLPTIADSSNSGLQVNPRYEYGYDSRGNQISIRENIKQYADGTIDRSASRETDLSYDEHNRLLTKTLPLGQTETRHYNGEGYIDYRTDADGRVTQYIYDTAPGSSGRVVQYRYFDSLAEFANGSGTPATTVRQVYDAFGHRVQMIDGRGTTTDNYDSRGRITRIVAPEGVLNYEYRGDTIQVARIYTALAASPSGPTADFRYTYDAASRLAAVSIIARNGIVLTQPETTQYGYDVLGSLRRVTYANGVIADYGYDAFARLVRVTNYAPDSTPTNLGDNTKLSEYVYALGLTGRRESVTETRLESSGLYSMTAIHWSYDNLDRLTSESVDLGNDGTTNRSTIYVYDLAGNRTTQYTDVNGDGVVDEAITYSYDQNDRLVSETGALVSGQATSTQFVYGGLGDPSTELTQKTTYVAGAQIEVEQDSYTYDVRGQMSGATVTRPENGHQVSVTTSYAYDDNGNRVQQTQSVSQDGGAAQTATTYYVVDLQNPTGLAQVLEETSAPTALPVRTYTVGLSVVTQADNSAGGGNSLTLLTDGHASTRLIVDAGASVQARYDYDAYGQPLNFTPGVLATDRPLTNYLYAGEQVDPGLQLDYLRARYYDAGTGRFTKQDSFSGLSENPSSLQRYVYAGDNPVGNVDSTGRWLVAFDGTGNHEKDTNRDGTPNFATNVWKMYNAYLDGFSHYYRGIGNSWDWDFDPQAYQVAEWLSPPLGSLMLGSLSGLSKAFAAGASLILMKALGDIRRDHDLRQQRTLDVIGFSRGSTLALEFTHKVEENFPDVRIRFVGLFDTVDSIGIPGLGVNPGYRLSLASNVAHAFHAISFDEDRAYFPATNVVGAHQEAFRGVHSDVGGGWEPPYDLWQVSLQWMIANGRSAGLHFGGQYDGLHPDPNGAIRPNEDKWGGPLYGGFVAAGLNRPTIQQDFNDVPLPLSWFGDDIDFRRVGQDSQAVTRHFLQSVGFRMNLYNEVISEFAFNFAMFGVI